MSSSLRLGKSYKRTSKSTVVLAASLVALAWGCGDVGVEDDLGESELPTTTEEGELPAATESELAAVVEASERAANENGQEDGASAVDKAALPVCSGQSTVWQQSRTQYFHAPSSPSQGIFCVLRKGARGTAVDVLKAHLINCHGATWASLDGQNNYFGDGMVGAMKWIQREAGITQDGVYGPQTFTTAMKWRHFTPALQPIGCFKFSG